ncbi:hypothetical protein GGE67_005654 [Rhizobium leucaenae]|nr:hypothetical protein [Rhizobium leucaenae]
MFCLVNDNADFKRPIVVPFCGTFFQNLVTDHSDGGSASSIGSMISGRSFKAHILADRPHCHQLGGKVSH